MQDAVVVGLRAGTLVASGTSCIGPYAQIRSTWSLDDSDTVLCGHSVNCRVISQSRRAHRRPDVVETSTSALPPNNGLAPSRRLGPLSARCGLVHRSKQHLFSITSSVRQCKRYESLRRSGFENSRFCTEAKKARHGPGLNLEIIEREQITSRRTGRRTSPLYCHATAYIIARLTRVVDSSRGC
jgi:hypothetical protein